MHCWCYENKRLNALRRLIVWLSLCGSRPKLYLSSLSCYGILTQVIFSSHLFVVYSLLYLLFLASASALIAASGLPRASDSFAVGSSTVQVQFRVRHARTCARETHRRHLPGTLRPLFEDWTRAFDATKSSCRLEHSAWEYSSVATKLRSISCCVLAERR